MLDAGLEPLDEYVRASDGWRCRCVECGSIVSPSYNNVRQARAGCIKCAGRGIDPASPAVLYLMTNASYAAVKIGIAAPSRTRIAEHEHRGWTMHSEWRVTTGRLAFDTERAILRWWRDDLGAPIAMTAEQMPQAGWTETASLVFVDPAETAVNVSRLIGGT